MNKDINIKMLPFEVLEKYCCEWRSAGETVALCHGCFDPIHIGHMLHFLESATIADRLIVTITPDAYVNKGPSRPYFSAEQRMVMVAALECVDYCSINLWQNAVETIRRLKPNYYVKGIDYKNAVATDPRLYDEYLAVQNIGGVMYFTKSPKYSSTELIESGIVLKVDENHA